MVILLAKRQKKQAQLGLLFFSFQGLLFLPDDQSSFDRNLETRILALAVNDFGKLLFNLLASFPAWQKSQPVIQE